MALPDFVHIIQPNIFPLYLQGSDDVDSAIREVNELLGESSSTNDPTSLALEANMATSLHRSLLAVDRRYVVYCGLSTEVTFYW